MRIPIIEDLTKGPVPSGSNLLVEYDPTSQWYNTSLTIAAGWLKAGGSLIYNAGAQSPDDVRSQLTQLGLEVGKLEGGEKLRIYDWYTATLGQKSKEKFAMDSLKVADLSIIFAKDQMRQAASPDLLRIADNTSTLARFNDDKAWVEFFLTRSFPTSTLRKSTAMLGVVRGVHGESVYRTLEGAVDGVIDFKLDDSGEEPRNLIRIRSMRKVGFDARWHQLKIMDNFEVSLEK